MRIANAMRVSSQTFRLGNSIEFAIMSVRAISIQICYVFVIDFFCSLSTNNSVTRLISSNVLHPVPKRNPLGLKLI